jgi:hypothetical protein
MSVRERVGLDGVSIQISFVSGRIRSATSSSMLGEKVTWTLWALQNRLA